MEKITLEELAEHCQALDDQAVLRLDYLFRGYSGYDYSFGAVAELVYREQVDSGRYYARPATNAPFSYRQHIQASQLTACLLSLKTEEAQECPTSTK